MNLSNTAQYAIRVITHMAKDKDELYPASRLVKELNVSDKYLKRILTSLTENGIIISIRGKYGGFKLNKAPEEIFLYDIISCCDNVEKYFGCVLGFNDCSDGNPCSLHEKWLPISLKLTELLKETTISEVSDNPDVIKV